MDLKELKELLELIAARDITEFELEEEGMKLRIRKSAASTNHSAPGGVLGAAPAPSPAPLAAAPAPQPPPAAPAADEALVIVKSPIVGTFYRTPDPNSPPFVNVGDRVRQGQVLCIIEAMKLMNEIESEAAGEVVRIHKESGQPVQFGEPLFSLRSG